MPEHVRVSSSSSCALMPLVTPIRPLRKLPLVADVLDQRRILQPAFLAIVVWKIA
jgi:hypothetical protein